METFLQVRSIEVVEEEEQYDIVQLQQSIYIFFNTLYVKTNRRPVFLALGKSSPFAVFYYEITVFKWTNHWNKTS